MTVESIIMFKFPKFYELNDVQKSSPPQDSLIFKTDKPFPIVATSESKLRPMDVTVPVFTKMIKTQGLSDDHDVNTPEGNMGQGFGNQLLTLWY